MPDSWFNRRLKQFSRKSRTKKFDVLLSLFQPRPGDRVLDIGADGDVFLRYTFEDVYPYPEQIVGGGYVLKAVQSARQHYPKARYAVLDGCALPFPDRSFDLVFSNAVIEHIVGEGRQELFAREVMRVGKSWFVTTPNYWFPFETHYHLPFIQFLPPDLQRPYNRLLGTQVPKDRLEPLALLSARNLSRLFPGSGILKFRVTLWPETLAAYSIDPRRASARVRHNSA